MEHQFGTLLVRFPDLAPAEASRAAADLERNLQRLTGGQIDTEMRKEKSGTQDAGSILAIVLGAEAVVVLADRIAGGIGDYLRRLNSRVEIATDQGVVVVTGEPAAGLDVAAVTTALMKVKERSTDME